ncbi:hypothetical protein PRZ48_006623 [Zasmidium cellare]|uniref:Uncharacterized protein n=1 Tax=Zasmidium cellare TaxID=395010 RepID=A0ABR0ENY2_ZASCE|nr:hypothetical protein PRZ48_006623 [Zasmidium cellare]
MAAVGANSEWATRMQKRRNMELTFLRRPSETESNSISASTYSGTTSATTTTSPASPESTHSSTKTSASYDQLQAFELQLARNKAQIEANEERMRELQGRDERMGEDIQARLQSVGEVNRQISILREMLERAERVSRGEFEFGIREV